MSIAYLLMSGLGDFDTGSTPIDPPGTVTGTLIALDDSGNPEQGIEHTRIVKAIGRGSAGISVPGDLVVVTSDSNGVVSFAGHVVGFKYSVRRENGIWFDYTAPATSPFSISSCAGDTE